SGTFPSARLRVIGDMTSRFLSVSEPTLAGEYNSDIDCPPICETPCMRLRTWEDAAMRASAASQIRAALSRAARADSDSRKIIAISAPKRERIFCFAASSENTRLDLHNWNLLL